MHPGIVLGSGFCRCLLALEGVLEVFYFLDIHQVVLGIGFEKLVEFGQPHLDLEQMLVAEFLLAHLLTLLLGV